MKTLKFNFQTPILESFTDNDNFIINGVAINATTTSNNHKFLPEELSKSANTLTNVPLLKDHNNSVDSIVGKVLLGIYNEESERVEFKAKVNDKHARDLIMRGDLNTVSVGASVEDIEEIDGLIIPKGITFKELSLVAVPADEGATFGIALKEAYLHSSQDDIKITKEDKMTEEETKTEPEKETESEPETDKTEEAVAELSKKIIALTDVITKMKEADADEVKVEPETKVEPKEVEEEEEDEEEEEVEESHKIVQGQRSFSYSW